MKSLFTEKDIQMADEHAKRCSTSLHSREMQIKSMMRYYNTSIRTTKIKYSDNTKWQQGNAEEDFSYTADGDTEC